MLNNGINWAAVLGYFNHHQVPNIMSYKTSLLIS